MNMDERELAIRCARGDNAARRELYETYGSRLLALCRRYAADVAGAEDLMQDAFVKIFRVIGRFRWTRPGSLYSWMARVALNLAFDSARKRRRLAQELVDVEALPELPADEPDYEEAASVPLEVLQAMMAALPEGYRTVFKLYCIDELSHKEIAALLGIKEKSSSASLARARASLAAAIRQYLADPPHQVSGDQFVGEGPISAPRPSPPNLPCNAAGSGFAGEGSGNEKRPSPKAGGEERSKTGNKELFIRKEAKDETGNK